MPEWAALACAALPALRAECPRMLPRGGKDYSQLWLVRPTTKTPVAEFMLSRGTAGGEANPPPETTQVTVVSGPAGPALRLLGERRPRTSALRSASAAGQRRSAETFGTFEWGGHRGTLDLTKSVSAIGLGNLLTFSWTHDGRVVAVGVGAWNPLLAAASTLRRIVAGGLGAPTSAAPSRAVSVAGVPMISTPAWLAVLCQAELGSNPCPATMPRPLPPIALVQVSAAAHVAAGREIDAAFGGESGNPRRDRPPFLVHLTFSNQSAPAIPATLAPVPIDLLRGGYPSHPVYLGAPVWGGHQGTLSLGAGLCFGNHLCYRWREAGRTYTLSMHAGYPLSQSLAVFRAVVRSTVR